MKIFDYLFRLKEILGAEDFCRVVVYEYQSAFKYVNDKEF